MYNTFLVEQKDELARSVHIALFAGEFELRKVVISSRS